METPLLLIDAYAQIYRSFHAVRGLSTSAGKPVNAVFAMTKFLMRLEKEFPSGNGAFVFDKGKPPRRMAILPEYKANRPPMPDELRSQIPVIRDMIRAFGWVIIEHEGYEADDLIGSISVTIRDRSIRIFSGDKDLSQLIDGRVEMMIHDHSGAIRKRGIAETIEKFGVPPERIADYLALLGDTADNIPGIPGVGEKTAAMLLNTFSCGKEIFSHPEKIEKESLRKKIEGKANQFEKNLALVLLDLVPPPGTEWKADDLIRNAPDTEKIRALCKKMELKSILKELGTEEEEESVSADDLFSVPPSPAPQKEEEKKEVMTQLELF